MSNNRTINLLPEPSADTILQPSLHSMEEYADLCVCEAESRGLEVADLRDVIDKLLMDEDSEIDASEIADAALDAIRDAGYQVIEENDSLLIFGIDEQIEPCDDDYIVTDTPRGYHVNQLDETFGELDEAAEAIADDMEQSGVYPSVWMVNERGSVSPAVIAKA